ncbi:hypothetical protein A2935_02700 [Candidatus Wolfebacteria bacterium RIFCSPLOWO2_01_FULL_47_17b]|uniref:Uncharacterized protein n=1 Tax=Candidatus Wolfebacteria bacterium RIFCSPLOWO2_01_FULL_47_17b TaxID=1802558 RepID=A0A1F8DZ64_9BACT|nr:MAG: hypothetical protein A2935_02700 [Candidatus Wolfebacteria bacterium RIFCSPLOWO2_01_FULL_47_17b]
MKQKMDMRKLAIALRKKGLSYNEIRQQVPISKSSLSLWLKHIRLSPKHRARLYTKQIQILSRGTPSQVKRRKREIALLNENARKEISLPLSLETHRFIGAALYWAEGSKTKNFEITNSDPVLIAFMTRWFERMFGVSPSTLKAYLNIYSQQNETEVKQFWSEITKIPIENFGKSFIKPASKGFKRNNLYYGTIKVYVPKGTDMRHKTFAWIQAALQDLVPAIESKILRWSHLKEVKRPPVNI